MSRIGFWTRRALGVAWATGAVLSAGCGDDEKACTSEFDFLPRLSPVSFGELYPLDDDGDGTADHDPNVATNERVPFEWVQLLDVPCDDAVAVTEVCLVGTAEAVAQYIVEGPVPATATGSDPAAVRITYNRAQPSGSVDDVVLVVQSNSKDLPTMLVPICAKVVPAGQEKAEVECAVPDFQVEVGQKVATETLAGELTVVCSN